MCNKNLLHRLNFKNLIAQNKIEYKLEEEDLDAKNNSNRDDYPYGKLFGFANNLTTIIGIVTKHRYLFSKISTPESSFL